MENGKKNIRMYEENEYSENKKRKIDGLNEDGKANAIYYALTMMMNVCLQCGIAMEKLNSVIPSMSIMAVCYRIHDYARGKNNVSISSSKTTKRDNQAFTFCVDGVENSIDAPAALALWKDSFERYKFKTARANIVHSEFFGETATIMALMNLFFQRVKELQIGPDSWISTKRDGNTIHHKTSTYGIHPAYRHMASGLSWEVSVRNTLSKHTTGLCQLALLSNAEGDKKYSNKNKANVVRDYGFLQHIDVISNFIQNNDKKTNAPIIDRMARITHLHGDKHKRRCSLCPCVIAKICIKQDKRPIMLKEAMIPDTMKYTTFIQGESLYSIEIPEEAIGFSSKKAVLCYNLISKIVPPLGCNVELFRELYFHATFGTQGEDFGILKFMTNRDTWHVREDFGNNFFQAQIKPKNFSGNEIDIIGVQKYSKNISATQSNILSSTGEIFGSMPTFAGYRMTRFTRSEMDFATKIKTSTTSSIDSNASSIIDYLTDVIKLLRKEIESSPNSDISTFKAGRTSWYSVIGATNVRDANGAELGDVPSEIGRSFWARKGN